MCPFARNMRSSSPPSVADESSVRRHIIKNSVDPKFRYGVSELKMLHAVRELCVCICTGVRMHMHRCMHAAGMQVYAGGMRNIEYRTKLRRTAQEQLGFSISSSRSSKYAQSVHTAQKNATHACLATAHFFAPPSMAM